MTDINIRFVDSDPHAYLSPASGRAVAYLTFCLLEEVKYLSFYQEFEAAMSEFHGRPHWGKINFITYEKALNLYGIHLQKFIDVKRRLDPRGVFSNSFTDRLFLDSVK